MRDERLLTVAQVGEILGIDVEVVAAHIRAGRLAASNVSLGSQRARYRITRIHTRLLFLCWSDSDISPQRARRTQRGKVATGERI